MMYVQDLKLEEDVLPFFDYTNNEQSASYLLALLKAVPDTEEEVLERQAIIKGFLASWTILEHFTYSRLNLQEVYTYFESVTCNSSGIGQGWFIPSFRLLLDEPERNRLRSRAIQVVLLLHDLKGRYLARLEASKFPEGFQKELQFVYSFLHKLHLETYVQLIHEGSFSIPKIVAFTQLLDQLKSEEVRRFWDFFFAFEAYWSITKGTLTHGFSFPTFSNSTFSVEEFCHPAVLHPVKNTLEFGENQNVLLLTGPNMAGKSTLLKGLAICVYLAHTGFTVPASSCKVPFFNSIATAINLNDNLRDGYSHFMTEIEHLKTVVKAAAGNKRCFAVFDEIFRGTNVDDALDITRTTVAGLAKFQGSFFLVSTHMLQLEDLLEHNTAHVRRCYLECVLENGCPQFSYTLKDGWSHLRIGRILFEKEGLHTLLSN